MPVYRDTIICEMIRPEANNKLSLFGVFGESIFVPEIPSLLTSLAILQRWAPTAGEVEGTRFQMSFELHGPQFQPIIFPPSEVTIPGPPRPLIQTALQLQGVPIRQLGDFEFVTFINGVERNRFVFTIALPPRPVQ